MNVNDLELYLQSRITNLSTDYDILLYTKAIQVLNSGGVFTANTASDLPSASQNEGKLYFIKDIEILAWSDGSIWKDIVLKSSVIDYEIFSWGSNTCGRLGDGTTVNRCSPVREISSSTNWCQVSTGQCHTPAIKTDGTLWAWGCNNIGQLGDGTVVDKCSPIQEISSSTNWCLADGGRCLSVAIKTNGTLWGWGYAGDGSLGNGTTTAMCSPVQEICSATNWCHVSSGNRHTTAVKTDGTLWAWGNGACGRLGDGTVTPRCSPVQEFCSATNWCIVSAAYGHTAALKTDGTIWTFGYNASGQLGDGTVVVKCSPVQEISSSTNWCTVSSAFRHTAAIKADGTLWSWGSGANGLLGNGATTGRCSPVQEICSATNWCQASAGGDHSAAIKTDGTIWSWGINVYGQLGNSSTTCSLSPVREISSSTSWSAVSASCAHSTAIKATL